MQVMRCVRGVWFDRSLTVAFGIDKLASLNPWSGGGTVGIDFGSQALKVLQLTIGEPPQLVAAACLQTPAEMIGDASKRFEWQCEQLPALIKTGGFKAKRASCIIPSVHMLCKHIQLSPEPKQDLAILASETLAGQLGCDPSMLSTRAIEVVGATAGGKKEVIAMATASGVVQRLMQALRASKLEPVGMMSEYQALVNAFRPINRRSADKELSTLYLDVGAASTKVCIGHGTDLVFAKSCAMGGRFLDQVVSQIAGCAMSEARMLRLGLTQLTKAPVVQAEASDSSMAALDAQMRKDNDASKSEAQGGANAAATVVKPVVSPVDAARVLAASASTTSLDLSGPLRAMTDEIGLCVHHYETLFPGKRLARVIFVGGESRHTALCTHIARALRIPAHAADPLARIARTGAEPCMGVDLSSAQPGWAIAVGLLLAPAVC